MSEQDRARAVLYGLALGDALGWPVEFLKMDKITIIYGPGGIQEPPDPALYTDDTQTTIAVVRALIEQGENSIEDVMTSLVSHLIAWSNSPENTRAPGHTLTEAVRTLEAGVPWRDAGSQATGNGSAIRVAPIGFLYQHDPIRLREVAEATSLATHAHPSSVASAIAAAYLVKLALDGVHPDRYAQEVLAFIGDMSEEFHDTVLRVGHVVQWTDELNAISHIGEGWVGPDAVAMSIYCAMRFSDDYVSAVRRAANISGDSDSVACVTGGLLAARNGLGSIPPEWIARLENRVLLTELADHLAAKKEMLNNR